MRKLSSIVVLLSAVLVAVSPASGAGLGGHGFSGAAGGGHVEGHQGFQGHPGFGEHPGFHHGFHHRGHVQFFVGPPVFVGPPYYYYYPGAYAYSVPAPAVWYYCPEYQAYYPDVQSCPESWVPVPAQ